MTKKLIALLVAGLTISAIVGCSKPAEGDNTTPPANTSTDAKTKTATPGTDAGAPGATTTTGTTGTTAGTPPSTPPAATGTTTGK